MDTPYKIRKATASDSHRVPEIMLQAMEDMIFRLIRQKDQQAAVQFLTQLFQQKGNLYSYENTFVAVDMNDRIIGSLTGYDGDRFIELRQPILDLIADHYANNLIPETETAGGEFYIDSIAVAPIARGKGIGTKLLHHAITHAQENHFNQVGLLVDLANPNARKLYERIGFNVGKKTYVAGSAYYHMYMQLT